MRLFIDPKQIFMTAYQLTSRVNIFNLALCRSFNYCKITCQICYRKNISKCQDKRTTNLFLSLSTPNKIAFRVTFIFNTFFFLQVRGVLTYPFLGGRGRLLHASVSQVRHNLSLKSSYYLVRSVLLVFFWLFSLEVITEKKQICQAHYWNFLFRFSHCVLQTTNDSQRDECKILYKFGM